MTKLQRKRAIARERRFMRHQERLACGMHCDPWDWRAREHRSAYHRKLPRWLYSVPLGMFCEPKSTAQSARRMLRGVPGWDERGRKL